MSQYRRVVCPGGRFFFTLVTYQRQKVFLCEENISVLRSAIVKVRAVRPFQIDAMVVLPDHIHCIWSLPENDSDYSGRWREIKKAVSKNIVHSSPFKTIWQRRFWEHVISDENDWRNHMDYIHFNPVKHGYVKSPADWPWSSFSRLVEKGYYESDWGRSEPDDISKMWFE